MLIISPPEFRIIIIRDTYEPTKYQSHVLNETIRLELQRSIKMLLSVSDLLSLFCYGVKAHCFLAFSSG